uniref:DIRP domain-containing protein n=1 Tax=Pinguiococcus pyrenoidosus TaxID=172671 RepID=A0A7R9YF29_9STRA|mmetsp:Transcript_5841/g.22749  ORF Transcript_5841/g.22749 Transcript_5841/m.22749 type:complete len:906 (+) Transcript_5841:238-2955(+)
MARYSRDAKMKEEGDGDGGAEEGITALMDAAAALSALGGADNSDDDSQHSKDYESEEEDRGSRRAQPRRSKQSKEADKDKGKAKRTRGGSPKKTKKGSRASPKQKRGSPKAAGKSKGKSAGGSGDKAKARGKPKDKLKPKGKALQASIKDEDKSAHERAGAAYWPISKAADDQPAPLRRHLFALGLALSQLPMRNWVNFEWIYSTLDAEYFKHSDFEEWIQAVSQKQLEGTKFPRQVWSALRSSIGKTRRTSAAFFRDERARLERYRQTVRVTQERAGQAAVRAQAAMAAAMDENSKAPSPQPDPGEVTFAVPTASAFPFHIPARAMVGQTVTIALRSNQSAVLKDSQPLAGPALRAFQDRLCRKIQQAEMEAKNEAKWQSVEGTNEEDSSGRGMTPPKRTRDRSDEYQCHRKRPRKPSRVAYVAGDPKQSPPCPPRDEGLLQKGVVLTADTRRNYYRIQLSRPELGTALVQDADMVVHGPSRYLVYRPRTLPLAGSLAAAGEDSEDMDMGTPADLGDLSANSIEEMNDKKRIHMVRESLKEDCDHSTAQKAIFEGSGQKQLSVEKGMNGADLDPNVAAAAVAAAEATKTRPGAPIAIVAAAAAAAAARAAGLALKERPSVCSGGATDANERSLARLQLMATLLKLLDRKEALLTALSDMNNHAENGTPQEDSVDESFRQQYAWLVVNIEATNRLLDPALHQLRVLSNRDLDQRTALAAAKAAELHAEKTAAAAASAAAKAAAAAMASRSDKSSASRSGADGAEDDGAARAAANAAHAAAVAAAAAAVVTGSGVSGAFAAKLVTDCDKSAALILDKVSGLLAKGNEQPEEDNQMAVESIRGCAALLLVCRACTGDDLGADEINSALRIAMEGVRPRWDSNTDLFEEIRESLSWFKNEILVNGGQM